MPERNESLPSVVVPVHTSSGAPSDVHHALRSVFREHYVRGVSFKEEARVADELEREAEPALELLHGALDEDSACSNLHEGYALLTLLARRAGQLGTTPSGALALADAVAASLRSGGAKLTHAREAELRCVVVEGYCAAREEQATAELRKIAAASQATIALAPGSLAIVLAGRHHEADLTPALESSARELLRQDAKSCLLELSRLELGDEELLRALGHFCAVAATLGVAVFIVGAPALLKERFERWSIARHASLFIDDYARARALALAAAGYEVRPVRRWARLLTRHLKVAAT